MLRNLYSWCVLKSFVRSLPKMSAQNTKAWPIGPAPRRSFTQDLLWTGRLDEAVIDRTWCYLYDRLWMQGNAFENEPLGMAVLAASEGNFFLASGEAKRAWN